MITWVNINGFSPNLVCALILWTCGLGSLMGKFRRSTTQLSARDTPIFSFPDDNMSKCQGILTKLILRRSGLGLLIGEFRQCLTELSVRDTIMAGYYSLMFFISICRLLKTDSACKALIALHVYSYVLSFGHFVLTEFAGWKITGWETNSVDPAQTWSRSTMFAQAAQLEYFGYIQYYWSICMSVCL